MPPTQRTYQCSYCGVRKPTLQGLKSHISQTRACKLEFAHRNKADHTTSQSHSDDESDASVKLNALCNELPAQSEDALKDVEDDSHHRTPSPEAYCANPVFDVSAGHTETPNAHNSQRARVEEVEDESLEIGELPTHPWVDRTAAEKVKTYRKGKTTYHEIQEKQRRYAKAKKEPENL